MSHIKDMDVRLNVISYDHEIVGDRQKIDNLEQMKRIEESCKAKIFSSSIAIDIYRQLTKRSVNLITKYRGTWEISPDLKINVMAFTKSKEGDTHKLTKYSKLADFDTSAAANLVQRDKVTFCYDDINMRPVDPENQIKGFYYGNKIVPVPEEITNDMKVVDDKCLKLLGFTEKKNVPRHHFMSGVDIVFPAPDEKNILAFNSIV